MDMQELKIFPVYAETLAIITKAENGAKLQLCNDGKMFFEKDYKSFTGALKAETYYLNRWNETVKKHCN